MFRSKPVVCVDLDGVLAIRGVWRGIDFIGEPIPGAADFTRQLSQFARVLIYTTRCRSYPEASGLIVDEGGGVRSSFDSRPVEKLAEVVERWLEHHEIYFDEVYTGQGKPLAAGYCDDRAVECRPQERSGDFALALQKVELLCGRSSGTKT